MIINSRKLWMPGTMRMGRWMWHLGNEITWTDLGGAACEQE